MTAKGRRDTMKNTAPPRALRGLGLRGREAPTASDIYSHRVRGLAVVPVSEEGASFTGAKLPAHGQRPQIYHEKHRAPARAPRAGVNGDGVPDSSRHLFNQARLEIERPTAGKAAAGDSTQAGARQARTLPTEGRQAAGTTPRRDDR